MQAAVVTSTESAPLEVPLTAPSTTSSQSFSASSSSSPCPVPEEISIVPVRSISSSNLDVKPSEYSSGKGLDDESIISGMGNNGLKRDGFNKASSNTETICDGHSSSPTSAERDRGYGQGQGNWKGKKSVLRDREAERADPDFARFVPPAGPPPGAMPPGPMPPYGYGMMGNMASNMGIPYGYGGFPGQQYAHAPAPQQGQYFDYGPPQPLGRPPMIMPMPMPMPMPMSMPQAGATVRCRGRRRRRRMQNRQMRAKCVCAICAFCKSY